MQVSREIEFRACHSHRGMLLEPQHFHDYKVILTMSGEPNEEGFLCDFRAVKRIFKRVVLAGQEVRNLDELFEYPTAEAFAQWIWHELSRYFPLYSVEVKEKPHSSAVYFGPGVLH